MYHSRVLFLLVTASLREWKLAGLQLRKDQSKKKKGKKKGKIMQGDFHFTHLAQRLLIPPCRHSRSLVLLAAAKAGLLRREKSCLGRQKSNQESSLCEGK